jgi:hypothetical protein
MTRRERAQVVELLRCAADNLHRQGSIERGVFLAPIMDTALFIYGTVPPIYYAALDARERCFAINDRAARFLEAALRVEQGEWP